MAFTEAKYEKAVIEVFRKTLGYGYVYGPNAVRDYADPLYMRELLPALRRINPKLPKAAITEAVYKLQNFEGGTEGKKIIVPIVHKFQYIEGKKMVKNARYFAFTATPKNKTLEMFGVPYQEGDQLKHRPYHVYTMKQAIEEDFILDVMRNYMPI
jgi:type I site-specific restriction-modification system R (restriction) subunit